MRLELLVQGGHCTELEIKGGYSGHEPCPQLPREGAGNASSDTVSPGLGGVARWCLRRSCRASPKEPRREGDVGVKQVKPEGRMCQAEGVAPAEARAGASLLGMGLERSGQGRDRAGSLALLSQAGRSQGLKQSSGVLLDRNV